MVWWYWMVLGLALLGAEMTTPGGFYIIFFGLSALVVGTLAGLNVVNAEWLQWLLFSVIAVGSLLLFRGPLMAAIKKGPDGSSQVDSMVGETAIPLMPIAVGDTGKANCKMENAKCKMTREKPRSPRYPHPPICDLHFANSRFAI